VTRAPLHLTARDFDAYGADQATSDASRHRVELERRALAWARGVVARLAAIGLEVDAHGSEELPPRRDDERVDGHAIRFCRDGAARDGLERLLDVAPGGSASGRHAFLALHLDAGSVAVCFALKPMAAVDVENLRARLARPDDEIAAELTAALGALPEQFTIGEGGDDDLTCSSVTGERVRSMLDRAAAGDASPWIGWRVPRATAIEHAELLDEQLEDALVALAPVYRLLAWSKDNDAIGLDHRLAGVARARARRAHTEAREGNGAASPPRPVAALEKGARVRVRSGPFADKVGTVSEVDGRGGARVMLGLLSSRFDLQELEALVEGRERAGFQSSHRRPLWQVPRKAR